jgi:predicted AlkP superfamily phosphohydrolase/phosphomutase
MSNDNGSPRRLFIFGWDCADWAVIEEGWRRGKLQNLRGLADRGQSGTLMSTLPPVTAPAWTSFITGVDPGEHGIFGFRSIDPQSYRPVTVAGGERRQPTLMKRADDAGYRTCLVTVPWTYPAEPLVHGAVVPGWDAPDESLDSCQPAEIRAGLARVVDRVPRRSPQRSGTARFLERLQENIEIRERICGYLIENTDPQIFMTVFSEPDHATHHYWHASEIPDELIAAYESVDQAMGRLIRDHVRAVDRVLIVSDHGGRPIHTHVNVGKLLADGGFLALSAGESRRVNTVRDLKRRVWNRLPPSLRNAVVRRLPLSMRRGVSRAIRNRNIDWNATQAFPRNDEAAGLGVDINLRSRYSRGCVIPEDHERVRRDVVAYLSQVTEPASGVRVFSEVLLREEAYEGAHIADAPDLLLVPSPGFGTRMGLDLTERTRRVAVGGHRREGVFVCNWELGLGPIVQIRELLPRVLESCGYELAGSAAHEEVEPLGYSDVEAEEMETRLRELGYIE